MKKWNIVLHQFVTYVAKKLKEKKKVFRKVKDHCCCIEKYQGTTHLMCNLQYEEYGCILVLAHNSSGCD